MLGMGNNPTLSAPSTSIQPQKSDVDRSRDRRRPHMHDVNMPSGVKTSITNPSKHDCTCSTKGSNLKLVTLKEDGKMSSREYKIVMDEMHKTLKMHSYTSYNIKLIQKVQNCCLWSKFRAREKQIRAEQKYCNEKMLFHGSPSADTIVKTGFDLGHARGGCFGKGVYFAEHSTKSNDYAGHYGNKKILLCRVVLGKVHTMSGASSDGSLTRPPPGYNSVKGQPLGHPEYVVYNVDQAYPEYLVHYDVVN